MKKRLLSIACVLAIMAGGVFLVNKETSMSDVEQLRAQHQEFLEKSPFAKTKQLSKKDRKALGLPPNAYNEQMWDLMMDPNTGRPHPERIMELQADLQLQEAAQRGAGGDANNPWIDRGPNNQGGRTRGLMFDPNDAQFERVFAGGVSGGLWVNEDITDANSSWTEVPGIATNIAVTSIISDPNDSMTFYIGSGESYTSGAATGSGVWKSEDGGVTWSNVLGGVITSVSNGNQVINGIFYINDLIARDVGATTELYAAVASAFYADAASPNNFQGLFDRGVYKSTDDGATWTRFPIQYADNSYKNPNDLELDINNNIWVTTTSDIFGALGGDIYQSTDGLTFSLVTTIGTDFGGTTGFVEARRTELEPSPTDANVFWVAANVNGAANLFTTTDAFTSFTAINEPSDVDLQISATDYTRGQAFYDLPIEADANGNLYVGGIDLFRSTNSGTTWSQISKWSNNNNLAALNVSLVHADHHAIVFRPNNQNQAIFGTDGGVFYSNSLITASASTTAIAERNIDYNTVQFYYGSIDQIDGADGDDLAGGTQDNGTQFTLDATAGANGYSDPLTGDGGYTEIDAADGYAVTTYPFNSSVYISYPSLPFFGDFNLTTPGPTNDRNGNFINEAELDKNLDILYSNATNSGGPRIERTSNFVPNGVGIVNSFIVSPLFTSDFSAFKVSQYTTGSTTLYAGLTNGTLLIGTDVDSSPLWTNITGPSFVGSISDIELGTSEQEIFVTIHNYGVTSIWYSSDAGATWSSKEGDLPEVPVKCILQNPLLTNEVIIGTELGVWGTADISVASPEWVHLDNGMKDIRVVDLDLRTSDNTILATSFGRGFFTSQFTSVPLTLGTDDNVIADNNISIFPKVSNGQITINSKINLGDASLEIYNLGGQKVHASALDLNTTNQPVDLRISSGMYIVKILGENYTYTDKLIIK